VSGAKARAQSVLLANDTDLGVLYVGQGIGRKNSRNAHDRLLSHTKLQQILAETITHAPVCEVLLLLYRFEHGQTLICNGGDFNLQAQASAQQDKTYFNRLTSVKLERKEAVALAEAGLINYFKPYYNTLLKTTNFAAKDKLKVLKLLMLWDLVENHAEAGRFSIELCGLFRNWSFMALLTASMVKFGLGSKDVGPVQGLA